MSSDLYTTPLEVWRPTSTPDGGGGEEETFVLFGTEPLFAKVDQPSARAQVVGAQDGATLVQPIYFDGVVDVRRGDELREPEPGTNVYRVISVVSPSEPVYTKANCERRQSEES